MMIKKVLILIEIYSDKMILDMDKSGIILKSGYQISFLACNQKWNSIKNSHSKCIGERDITAKYPYYIFYLEKRIIKLEIRSFFKKKIFNSIKHHIEISGYTTFDLS
jgi:hypothetical protein